MAGKFEVFENINDVLKAHFPGGEEALFLYITK